MYRDGTFSVRRANENLFFSLALLAACLPHLRGSICLPHDFGSFHTCYHSKSPTVEPDAQQTYGFTCEPVVTFIFRSGLAPAGPSLTLFSSALGHVQPQQLLLSQDEEGGHSSGKTSKFAPGRGQGTGCQQNRERERR